MKLSHWRYLLLLSMSTSLYSDEMKLIFQDDFNRQNKEILDNEWISRGAVTLKDQALNLKLKEEEFRPRTQRTFPAQNSGKLKVSFLFDMIRSSEGTWAFYIHLGDSKKMPKSLVYDHDLARGVGVNLGWGGGELVGFNKAGTFGYFIDKKFNPLFVCNDSKEKDTLVEKPVLTIEVDFNSSTFQVDFNGKTYKDLPLENEGPIDTIRFVANGCSTSGFSKSSIDDIHVLTDSGDFAASTSTDKKEGSEHAEEKIIRITKGPRIDTTGDLLGVDTKTFKDLVAPVLEKYCIDCHGPDEQKARLRFDGVGGFRISDRHLWTMIHEQVAFGDMPPAKKAQLEESEKKKFLAWIEKEQRALGAGSTRRLNRREFSAALQDVSGLPVDFAYSLPGDSKVEGFDTGAEALQDAADSVNQMMEVTRRVVSGIRFLEPAPSEMLSVDLVNDGRNFSELLEPWNAAGFHLEKLPRDYKDGLGVLIEPQWPKDRGSKMFNVPVPEDKQGLVRIKLSVSSYTAFPGIPNPFLWVRMGGRMYDQVEITGPMDLEYVVQLEDTLLGSKGLGVEFTPRVEMPYEVEGFANEDKSKPDQLPEGAGLFRPVWDSKTQKTPDQQPRPFLVLKGMEVEPQYVAAWPPAHWNVDLGEIKDSNQSAEKLLNLWMERAYRRPAEKSERERFISFYKELRGRGMTFDDALRNTFQSVLMSSPFRYLDSTAHKDKVVADHAVATRLSFMLVGAPPDEELRKLAESGKIRQPEVLNAQTKRLLTDARNYNSFLRPFITQWLEMEQPVTLADDRRGKASYHFRRHLGDSMREETYSYIHQIIRENRPASELISSNWTMMNDTLANHYGYDGIEGGHLRKVTLRKEDKRGGGIMSHAGIQSMLCWMGDNWVIYRGAWAARHILNDPPQLPPLEVPELDPTAGDNKYLTARELMALHREDKNCSVCHTKLDPIGFAFQNFDISGRWREVEHEFYVVDELDSQIAWRGTGKTRPVDTLGVLPGGEEYRDYEEFKKLIVSNYQNDMVRGIMKNFLLFATGRKPDIDDMAEIDAIMVKQADKGYPMQDMLLAVFQTKAFLEH